MNIDIAEANRFMRAHNPILYYRVCLFHEDLVGSSKSCNMFELMYLSGSEKSYNNFEQVKLDSRYISYLPLSCFPVTIRGTRITESMNKTYPWYKLAMSIISEGLRTPLIVQTFDSTNKVRVIEGKHRIGAIGMIKPYDPDYIIPSIAIVLDPIYTVSMYKKSHPDPATQSGFRKMESK